MQSPARGPARAAPLLSLLLLWALLIICLEPAEGKSSPASRPPGGARAPVPGPTARPAPELRLWWPWQSGNALPAAGAPDPAPAGQGAASAPPARYPAERDRLLSGLMRGLPDLGLAAASGKTVLFRPHNGQAQDGAWPQVYELPHLVLYRNGELTEPIERTLIATVANLEVPPPGITVTIELWTQHGDPDRPAGPPARLLVAREARWIPNHLGRTEILRVANLQFLFEAHLPGDGEPVPTPTDYYHARLSVVDARTPWHGARHTAIQDYALLLENQWIVPLPEVPEEAPGAAPDELIVHYCDMFPFNMGRDAAIARARVSSYVQSNLIPALVAAYGYQVEQWGFRWPATWTSYREQEDGHRLSLALARAGTWYHGPALGRGASAMSLTVSVGWNVYDSLTDGLVSTFYHELFHNLQLGMNGSRYPGGKDNAWEVFSEGTAELAATVGQPRVEFSKRLGLRAYLSNAVSFLGRDGFAGGGLNESYDAMSGYHAAVYWRFLYEQCGGLKNGREDPAAGMDVIRRVLNVLYSGEVVDVRESTRVVPALPPVVDRALRGSACPFHSYEESLLALARAVYGLRLEGGRCDKHGRPDGCGFYDPRGLYPVPPGRTIRYSGTPIEWTWVYQHKPAGIPSSYGIDLVDVILDPAIDGQSLVISLQPEAEGGARFQVQVVELIDAQDGSPPRPVPGWGRAASRFWQVTGELAYVIPEVATADANRLGLIITRMDPDEDVDPAGAYRLVLRPGWNRPAAGGR